MTRRITHRTKGALVIAVAAGLGLSAAVAAVAGSSEANPERHQANSARLTTKSVSTTPTDTPFGPILPPRPLTPDSPAGKQYIDAKRDVRHDSLQARSFVADQIEAHYFDRGLSSVRTTGPRSLTVRWKGAAPKDVREVLTGRPLGIAIRLTEGVTYSRAETTRAMRAVANHPDARKVWKVSGTSSDGRGTGIEVYLLRRPSAATKHAIAKTAGIPVNDITFKIEKSGPTPL